MEYGLVVVVNSKVMLSLRFYENVQYCEFLDP